MKNNSSKAPSAALKMGGSQMMLCAAAILIAILVNLIAARLPSTATQFDLSSEGFFTLSEQTKNITAGLTEPVTIYLIAETGAEDDTVSTLLDRYAAASSNITVEQIDPVLYPNFTANYTTESLADNSVIVESAKRFKVVDNSKIFVQDLSSYYTTGQVSTSFDGEGAITSALSYVVTDDLPVVYALTGHGEASLSQNLQNMIGKDNYTLSSLELLTEDGIPDDCDALLIVSPQTDITEREKEAILSYMEKGGSVMLFADLITAETPNLDALLDAYGLQLERGIVIERGGNNFLAGGYYHYLLPDIKSHGITASLIENNKRVLLPAAQAVTETASHRSSLSVTTLLTTTSESYLKPSAYEMTTMEKETGDIDGPFPVGMAVTEETSGGTTHLAVFTSSYMLDDSFDQIVYSANSDMFLSALGWMCQYEQSMSIHAKAVNSEVLVVPASAGNTWGMIMVIVLPLALLALGLFVTLSRRKK